MGGVYNMRTMPAEIVVCKGEVVSRKPRKSDSELIEDIIGACE